MEQFSVPCEFKTTSDEGVFEGYASVFGTIDSYDDIVAPGAFAKTLTDHRSKSRMPAMLFQHDVSRPIGVYEAMREDEKGLFARGRLALKTPDGAATYELLKMGAMSGLSIGFRTKKSTFDNESSIRTLTEVQLFEVSPVVFPANDPARISSVKGTGLTDFVTLIETLLGGTWTEREAERALRDAGFSRDQSKHIIATGYRQRGRRDAMPSEEACGELLALVKQRTAIFTGDQRHGRTDTR